MLAVMVLSQHRVSTSKTVSPRIPVGARCSVGIFGDRNQAIILVILVLVSLIFLL